MPQSDSATHLTSPNSHTKPSKCVFFARFTKSKEVASLTGSTTALLYVILPVLMQNELYLAPKTRPRGGQGVEEGRRRVKAQIKHLQAELAARKSISGLDAEDAAEEVDEEV
jgi:hypothetical protein